jgi:hypothetical protein
MVIIPLQCLDKCKGNTVSSMLYIRYRISLAIIPALTVQDVQYLLFLHKGRLVLCGHPLVFVSRQIHVGTLHLFERGGAGMCSWLGPPLSSTLDNAQAGQGTEETLTNDNATLI